MISKDILKKIRKLEIHTKGLVNNIFGGEYQSAFKGRGMEFAEVRAYNFGDDIRQIDMGHYANGVYMLRIMDADGLLIRHEKIVKQH